MKIIPISKSVPHVEVTIVKKINLGNYESGDVSITLCSPINPTPEMLKDLGDTSEILVSKCLDVLKKEFSVNSLIQKFKSLHNGK